MIAFYHLIWLVPVAISYAHTSWPGDTFIELKRSFYLKLGIKRCNGRAAMVVGQSFIMSMYGRFWHMFSIGTNDGEAWCCCVLNTHRNYNFLCLSSHLWTKHGVIIWWRCTKQGYNATSIIHFNFAHIYL